MPAARRIFAGVSGSPGSVHALRQAAGLAHHHDAVLIPVLAWLPPVGTGRRGRLRWRGGCRISRYCLAHAGCPVLAIPPPSLAQQAGHGLRGWAFRQRWARAAAQPA